MTPQNTPLKSYAPGNAGVSADGVFLPQWTGLQVYAQLVMQHFGERSQHHSPSLQTGTP